MHELLREVLLRKCEHEIEMPLTDEYAEALPQNCEREVDVLPEESSDGGEREPDWLPQEVSHEAKRQRMRNLDTRRTVASGPHQGEAGHLGPWREAAWGENIQFKKAC